ncbi:TetR/AcrR family transcriptional regulator [Winogradskya humida]|uniref:TetR family transcriptional regulator n=1 Tax=Winogradskya humida TaxID=113566 RepID=A0ABQ4A396_9ACTN|nr:TetR/AcrR family transcriptional regulator [Actinoplanes humidus]GIE25088.1 TetR family transcriptional regulator [Actinoplanes humidus]
MTSLGRPRAKGPSKSGLSTEQDILVAAARLFCEAGYGGASTHKIAAAAGISQATMYHYFPGKQAILLRLLLATVRPSVTYALGLAGRDEPADVRLWGLCAYDVRLLLSGRDNIGALYLIPEVGDEAFAEFRAEHARLYAVYHDLVTAVTGVDDAAVTGLVFGLVESVILRRRAEPELDADTVAPALADAVLRVLRVPEQRLKKLRAQAF